MPRPHLAAILLTLALVACATPTPSPIPSPSLPTSSPTASVPRPSPAATASPAGKAGRPYDGPTILTAMRASRRPGGVPDQIETLAIAQAIADELWTWDGAPWAQVAIGGTCGQVDCSVEVVGARLDTPEADLYTFQVDPSSETVQLGLFDLHGYPAALNPVLDSLARELLAPDALTAMVLVGARWMPPPNEGQFWLAYRSGGEEGSPGLDVLLDRAAREVIETVPIT